MFRPFVIALFLFIAPLAAQTDSADRPLVRLTLRDGSELIGTVIARDSLTLSFTTAGGVPLTFPASQVATIDALSGSVRKGRYLRPDPNATRLFFAPTGRSLGTGRGYFSAYQIFFPFIAVGAGDHIILAGGMTLFPGASSQLLYFAPKVTPVRSENFNLAAGMLYMTAGGNDDGTGIYYTVATLGSDPFAMTVGTGWGFSGDRIAEEPVLLLGGELRMSNSTKLITENWFIPGSSTTIVSFGIRFFGDNLAADLGFINLPGTEMEGFPFIPWIGFAYNFGRTP